MAGAAAAAGRRQRKCIGGVGSRQRRSVERLRAGRREEREQAAAAKAAAAAARAGSKRAKITTKAQKCAAQSTHPCHPPNQSELSNQLSAWCSGGVVCSMREKVRRRVQKGVRACVQVQAVRGVGAQECARKAKGRAQGAARVWQGAAHAAV